MNSIPVSRRKSGFTLIELLVVIAIIAILAAILFPVFARARENARRASCQSNEKNIALGFKQYIQDSNDKYPPAMADSLVLKNSSAMQPYIKSTAIFYCPSDSNKTAGSYGYMLNGQNESAIQNTETTALLKETSATRHFEGQNIAFVDGHVKWGKGTGDYAAGATQGSATPPATPWPSSLSTSVYAQQGNLIVVNDNATSTTPLAYSISGTPNIPSGQNSGYPHTYTAGGSASQSYSGYMVISNTTVPVNVVLNEAVTGATRTYVCPATATANGYPGTNDATGTACTLQ